MNVFRYIKEFFFLNLSDYPNIAIDFPIGIFIIILAFLICLGCFYINYYKMYTMNILKQLIRHKAYDEENSKTLADLRLTDFVYKYILRTNSGRTSSLIKRQGEVKMTYEEYIALSKKKGYKEDKIDFSSAKFYIPAERASDAKHMVDTDSSSHLKPILLTVMVIALLVCLTMLVPEILNYINNTLNQ